MRPEWNIPGDVEEFFRNGPAQYEIRDPSCPCDNIEAMGLLMDGVGGLRNACVLNDGTYCEFERNGKRLGVHSGGLGDFHLHGFEVVEVEEQHNGGGANG